MVYQWACEKCDSYNIYVETCANCGHIQKRKGIFVTTFEEIKK